MIDTQIIFEKSVNGREGFSLPETDTPKIKISENIPSKYLREEKIILPEISEPQVIRHYLNLSNKNHHVDKDFYPLGSCTMKYNPKINDKISQLAGFAKIHPCQPAYSVQGALHVLYDLEHMLCKITGMSAVTLQPNAGSQGELLGILIMKKYHNCNSRKYILVPDTAHGTNFSSIAIGGFKARVIKSDKRGRVDIDDLRNKLDNEVAGLMLTQPNTLGLFEDQIDIIAKMVHDIGGLMYMDGANLNALVGLCKPSDMGFDIVHINLHKTFSTPHGGGGPGSGPIGVTKFLEKYLPIPRVLLDKDKQYYWETNYPDSIGNVHSFYGNFGILVRAYTYIKTLGDSGLKLMNRHAIINANYIKNSLVKYYDIPYKEGTLHEFVASGIKQKDKGVKVLDIAKKLLDYGFHAPTIYFPSVIPEAIMIEPTESESKETLDRFINTMIEIDTLIEKDPNLVINSPLNTPIKRLNETQANRKLNLRWKSELST